MEKQSPSTSELGEVDSNPKVHLLTIMLKNLPLSATKGKIKNLENESFEEFFNLLSLLIKSCASHDLNGEEILSKGVDTIRLIQNMLSKKISDSK